MLRRWNLPTNRLFWAVSLGHAANDFFMNLRSVLFTFIRAYILPMSSREIALGISLSELSGALSQPFFGWLADKTGGRWLGAIGVSITVSMMLLGVLAVSLTGSYWLMVIPMTIAGLGSGAFHPFGTMYAADVDPRRASRNAALFFMFGQTGLAISPVLAGLLLNNAHTHIFAPPIIAHTLVSLLPESGTVLPIFALALLAVPGILLMALTPIPRRPVVHPADVQQAAERTARAAIPWKIVVLLAFALMLRSPVAASMVQFMPLIFQLKGWTPAEYGLLTGLFWLASGITGVWFGHLGDRYDSRRVIMWSLIIAAPGIFLLAQLNGILAVFVAIGIGAMGGSHSLVVVLVQGLLPGRKGFASGVILGAIFATGAFGNLIVGDLIDRIGMVSAFQWAAAATLIGSILWLWLPAPQRHVAAPLEVQPALVTAD